MNVQLHFTDALGRAFSVTCEANERDATYRLYGKEGCTSGEQMGMRLPYDNEKDFDWALIGARPWTNPDDEMGVMYRGDFYKRRALDAQTGGKKMPAVIRYSRGARPTDPAALKEGDEAGVQYVCLCIFKGGKRQEQWSLKQGTGKVSDSDTPKPAPQPVQAQTPLQQYSVLTAGTRYAEAEGSLEILRACEAALGITTPISKCSEALKVGNAALIQMILKTAETWIAEDANGSAA